MPPSLKTTSAPHKLYRLFGEHVQGWCSAASIESAEQLLEQHLEPFELSDTDLREVPEEEWPDFRIRRAPTDSTTPSTGAAQLLSLDRGDFHFPTASTVPLTWCHPTAARIEYPPSGELVWICDDAGSVRRARQHWEPGMPLPGGDWHDEHGAPISTVLRWLPLEESATPPPPPDLTTP